MNQTIRLNPKVCVKVAEQGRKHIDAFLFVVKFASFVSHPIIFNHRANLKACRTLLGFTDHRYRLLLNSALKLGYAFEEGNHLRLLSKTQERKRFNANSKKDVEIPVAELEDKFNLFVLGNNIKKQETAVTIKIKQKAASYPMAGSTGANNKIINTDITMGVRNAAKLLNTSISKAHRILHRLNGRGLTIQNNIVHISKQEFKDLLNTGNKGVRYKNGDYLLVKARIATIDKSIFRTPTYKHTGFSYCGDCC